MNSRFSAGRYGFDSVSLILLLVAVVIVGIPYLWVASLALAVLVVLRAFSRNTAARSREQWAFSSAMGRVGTVLAPGTRAIGRFFSTLALRVKQRKTHVFVHCPSCHKLLRLPRGRGKLAVTCPVCHCSFIHKT